MDFQALQAQRDNLLLQVGNLEEQIDDMDDRGLRQTQERNDLMDRREDLINQLVPIQQQIQNILNPPQIPFDPNASSSSSQGGSFIPSRGNTKLNQKIEGGRLRGMKFHSGFVNKVIKPVSAVVSAVGIPVVKTVASVVAPEAIPAIAAFDAAKKGIETARGGSFDPQGNRIPSSNKGRLGGRKDADYRKDKPKNPNEKNPNDKNPKGGALRFIMP